MMQVTQTSLQKNFDQLEGHLPTFSLDQEKQNLHHYHHQQHQLQCSRSTTSLGGVCTRSLSAGRSSQSARCYLLSLSFLFFLLCMDSPWRPSCICFRFFLMLFGFGRSLLCRLNTSESLQLPLAASGSLDSVSLSRTVASSEISFSRSLKSSSKTTPFF